VQAIIILNLSGEKADTDDHSSAQNSFCAIDFRLIICFDRPFEMQALC
jgi:hypothetical protein